MQPRLFVEQKLTVFVNKYHVLGTSGAGERAGLVAFAQQKRFKFRELLTFYTDESKGKKYQCGYRVFAGTGRLAFASYESDPALLHPGDIARLLNSFHVH